MKLNKELTIIQGFVVLNKYRREIGSAALKTKEG